ncbi:MAG: site-2 protease family protein, partial [Actinomycetota bacterium]|nr:site-2 protease family protein [Actinomycetota bacterium]
MGPVIMIIGVILMIVIHEGGHFVAAKAFGMKATEAFFGFGPRLWSTKRGETEYGIKAIPFGGYVRIIGMNPFEEIAPEEEGRTYRVAPFWKKSVVVLAGIMTHFVVAFLLLYFIGLMFGTVSRDENDFSIRTTTIAAVSETVPDGSAPSPALVSGAAEGDVILSVAGSPVSEWSEFVEFTAEHGGETVDIGVARDGKSIELTATLAIFERSVRDPETGVVVVDSAGVPVTEQVGFFGVVSEPLREQPGVIGMVPVAGAQLGEAVAQSVKGLWEMVISFPKIVLAVFGGDDEVLETVRPVSPIGLVQLAGPIEGTLQLLALVNIFVGVLNFVPLYPLDGGHFAVAGY